jgi:methylmalonyl-CoA mutase N-terminal domain/subunit
MLAWKKMYIGYYVNQMEIVAKKVSNAGHPVSNKMQVTTILNSLPLSWEHMVTSLTHSGKEICMTSVPMLLVLEEVRMKRRRIKGAATNLLLARAITQKSHTPTFHGKLKKFKRKWKGKPRGNFKNRCGKTGHFKVNCLKNNGGKK